MPNTSSTNPDSVKRSSFAFKTENYFIILVLLILLVSGIFFGFNSDYFGKKSFKVDKGLNEDLPNKRVSSPSSAPIIETPSPSISPTVAPSTAPVVNGANLNNIKFTLPEGWQSEFNNDSLMLSPKTGGGFLSIKVYTYSSNIEEKEYYCQVSNVCIQGITYFTEMNIGNISGYMANALDNSGGGEEYFGAKGNKFYIISSYSPPFPNEFDNNYQQVLNSLIF